MRLFDAIEESLFWACLFVMFLLLTYIGLHLL